jgi:hypothetical protein
VEKVKPDEKSANLTKQSTPQQSISPAAMDISKLLAWARAMALKQSLTEAQADIHLEEWFQIAAEFGFPALSIAVRQIMRESTDWFPSVKQIREAIGPVGKKRDKAEAQVAWEAIRQHFYTCPECDFYHYDNKPLDTSERARRALRLAGGKDRIIHTIIADLHWVQDKFIEAYEDVGNISALESLSLPPADSPVGKLLAGLVARKS